MPPWPSGTADCIACPRRRTARTASAKASEPAATTAANSPTEWPAAAAGRNPSSSASTRNVAVDTVSRHGWVFSVSAKFGLVITET